MLESTRHDAGRGETGSDAEGDWVKSSFCSAGGCVEVAMQGMRVVVRDSKAPDAGSLSYTRDEWQAFVAGVKRGEFDL